MKTIAQNNYLGEWNDYWGSSFNIKSDSTFEFSWHFDLFERWSNGVWIIKNDTIYFRVVPVYDTLKYSSGYSLVLSEDEKPKVFIPKILVTENARKQDSTDMPTKLFYQEDKLYTIGKNGKLIKKKTKKWKARFPFWYVRREKFYK